MKLIAKAFEVFIMAVLILLCVGALGIVGLVIAGLVPPVALVPCGVIAFTPGAGLVMLAGEWWERRREARRAELARLEAERCARWDAEAHRIARIIVGEEPFR